MSLIRLLLLSAFFFPAPAYSACTPTGQLEFKQHLDRSNEAIGRDDLIGYGTAVRELKEALPCLTIQLPAADWASFLVGLAIVDFASGREWSSLLNTAYQIDPNLHIDYGPPEIRQYLPKRAVSEMRPVADNGSYFLDGLPLSEVGTLEGLHVAQRFADENWQTRVLEDDNFPEEWLAPKPTEAAPAPAATTSSTSPTRQPKKGTGLLITGTVMTVAGTAGWGGSYMVLTNAQYPSQKTESTLKALNIASGSVAITGIGLGVVGFLATPQTSGPVQLGFSGNGIQLNGVLP